MSNLKQIFSGELTLNTKKTTVRQYTMNIACQMVGDQIKTVFSISPKGYPHGPDGVVTKRVNDFTRSKFPQKNLERQKSKIVPDQINTFFYTFQAKKDILKEQIELPNYQTKDTIRQKMMKLGLFGAQGTAKKITPLSDEHELIRY